MRSDPAFALIDQIYDTVLTPARWTDTLTSVSEHIGASFMSVVPYDDPSLIFMSKGGEHAMAGYSDYWYSRDTMVKVGIENKHSRNVLCDWSSIGIKTINKDDYYQEFRRKVGIGFCLGATFEAYPGDFRALGINLPLGRQTLDDDEIDKIDMILRHLARAITLSSRTSELAIPSPAFSEILDCIRCGAAVIDSGGRVVVANRLLLDLATDGLTITTGRIKCSQASCQAHLDLLIQRTISGFSSASDPDFALIARPSGQKPFMARAVPLSRPAAESIWRKLPAQKHVLVLVVDLAAERTASCEKALRQLGLTGAEAKVANLVGAGLSPRQAAAQIGTTEGTVRNQMKQVFAKMGLTRQSDLVRAVSQLKQM